eukprot:403335380
MNNNQYQNIHNPLTTSSIILNQQNNNAHSTIFFNNNQDTNISQIIQSQPTPTSQINLLTTVKTIANQIGNYHEKYPQNNHQNEMTNTSSHLSAKNAFQSYQNINQKQDNDGIDIQEIPVNDFIDDEEEDIDIDEMSSSSAKPHPHSQAFSLSHRPHEADHRKMNSRILQVEKTSNNMSTGVQQINQSNSLNQPNNSSITRKQPQNLMQSAAANNNKSNNQQQFPVLRQPLNSSEMYNAFAYKKDSVLSQDAHTPISTRDGQSRIQGIQSHLQQSQTANRKLEQQSYQEQPKFSGKNFFIQHRQNQNDLVEEEDTDMIQDDQQQDEEEYPDHNMTEQDIDGHQDEEVVEDEEDGNEQEDNDNNQEQQSQQDQDYQDDYQHHDDEDEYHQDQEEDDYNTANEDNDGDVEDDSNKSQSPDLERPSQPIQIQNPNQFEYFSNSQEQNTLDFSQSDNASHMRPSSNLYQIRSSSQTDKSSTIGGGETPFFNVNNCSNAIVERNDRFLVLKMVPQQQTNTTSKSLASSNDNTGTNKSLRDQQPPQLLLGERNLRSHNNKVYRETVEEINSSDDSEQKLKQDQFFKNNSNQKTPLIINNNNFDQSLIEESRINHNQIRTMKNQIVSNQQQQLHVHNALSEFRLNEYSKTGKNQQQNHINYPLSFEEIQSQNQIKKQNYMEEEEQKESLDIQSQKSKQSSFSNSRISTTSDKFNKLQKLEKKNVVEELPPNFTMTKENLNFFFKQNNNQLDLSEDYEHNEVKGLNERRQSDSAVIMRNSNQLQQEQISNNNKNTVINYEPQSQQHSTQKISKKSYDYKVKTNITSNLEGNYQNNNFIEEDNQQIKQINKDILQNKPQQLQKKQLQQNNEETVSSKDSKLLEEYKQLKQIMKQMEKNPKNQQSSSKQGRSKNNNLLVSKSTNQQLQSLQKQEKVQGLSSRDQSQIKEGIQNKLMENNNKTQMRSRKNLGSQQSMKDPQIHNQQFYQHNQRENNLISSYLSEGGMGDEHTINNAYNKRNEKNDGKGLLSVQQSTKYRDGDGKKLFKNQNTNINQQQTARNEKKAQQKMNKQSHRQSPNARDKSNHHERQLSRGTYNQKSVKQINKEQRNFKHSKSNRNNSDEDSSQSSADDYQNDRERDCSSHSSPEVYQNRTYIQQKKQANLAKIDQSLRQPKSTFKSGQQQRKKLQNDSYRTNDNQKYQSRKHGGADLKSVQQLKYTNTEKNRGKNDSYDEEDEEQSDNQQHYDESDSYLENDNDSSGQKLKKHRHHKKHHHHHETSHDDDRSDDEDQESLDHSYDSYSSQEDNDESDNQSDYDQEDEDHDSYDSQSQSSQDAQKSRHHRPKHGDNKGKKITKTVKHGDRRFKININMHGHGQDQQHQKKSKKGQNQQQHIDEHDMLLIKQRQILQQQQLMLQMAQYPQQQLMLQQQLALQQQMMLQQPNLAQQNTFMNPVQSNIQSTLNLGGMQSPHMDIGSPTTFHNYQGIKTQNTQANAQSFSQNTGTTAASLKRNISGTNLMTARDNSANHKNFMNNQRDILSKNLSPKRDMNIGYGNAKYEEQQQNQYPRFQNQDQQQRDQHQLFDQKSFSQIRSPRDDGTSRSFINRGEYGDDKTYQNQHQQQQQVNYLNQLKNRFRTGNNPSDEYQANYDDFADISQNQIGSRNRNQQILQNNSSPVQNQGYNRFEDRQNKDTSYERNEAYSNEIKLRRLERGNQDYSKRNEQRINQTKFEEAKGYAFRENDNRFVENLRDRDFEDNLGSARGQIDHGSRHARTNSYVPPDTLRNQQQQQRQMKSNFGNQERKVSNGIFQNQNFKNYREQSADQESNDFASDNVTPIQRYEYEEGQSQSADFFNYHEPTLSKKKTGEFPAKRKVENRPQTTQNDTTNNSQVSWPTRKQNPKDESHTLNIDVSRSPQERDLSMDEGVSVANLRESMQLSPKADFTFKQGVLKSKILGNQSQAPKTIQDQKVPVGRPSLAKQQSMKEEPSKKKAQMLLIGFDDEDLNNGNAIASGDIQDPFKNKPQLKAREKVTQKQFENTNLRSKSSKPILKAKIQANVGNQDQSTQPQQQKRVPYQRNQKQEIQQQQDQQPYKGKQPLESESFPKNEGSQTPNMKQDAILQLKNLNQSPLKKAVKEIKGQENLKSKEKAAIQVNLQQFDQDDDDVLDPTHNKGLAIEIFDKKQAKGKSGAKQEKQEKSLAEMFLEKKKEALLAKQDNLGAKKGQMDQDSQAQFNNFEKSQDRPIESNKGKQEKSKEELAELRKKMMKNRVKRTRDNFSQNPQGSSSQNPNGLTVLELENKNKKAAANEELMMRLAMGKKVQVDKKEMKKLTSKNFQNLPEIKKKKEDEIKIKLQAERKAAAAQYMKEFAEKRRQQVLKKKKSGHNLADDNIDI